MIISNFTRITGIIKVENLILKVIKLSKVVFLIIEIQITKDIQVSISSPTAHTAVKYTGPY